MNLFTLRLFIAATIVSLFSTNGRCTVPVRFTQTPHSFDLRVPVTVNGKSLSFIVDTGCTYNLIDQSHREDLSRYFRNVDIRSIGGSHQSPLFTRNNLAVPSVFNVKSDLLLVDLSRISSQFAKPVDGCLGMNALRAIGFGIDGAANALYFERDTNHAFAVQSKLRWSNTQTPQTQDIDIEGVDDSFEIDTGADNGLSVPPETFTALLSAGKIHSLHASGSSSTYGIHTYRSGRLANAKIWGVEFHDIPINDSSHARIGMDIVRKFDFYFDFPNDHLLLQPTERCREPFEFDRSGLQLSSINNQIVITKVAEASPAAEAGVVAGDVLTSVNGETVARENIEQIKSQLTRPRAEKIDVRIRRRNQNYAGAIRLKDYQSAR